MIKDKKLTINNWAEEDRPREKMLLKGVNSLSDAELLAILIASGNRDETAVELSQRILQYYENNLNLLGKCTIKELCDFKGIGDAKAITIIAALELGRRRNQSSVIERRQILASKDVYEYFHPLIGDLPHEELWIILLSQSNKIINKRKISQGGIAETSADIRLILKYALEDLATGIILCHNHPSGLEKPSSSDNALTRKLQDSCKVMNIRFIDHVIISDNKYYSYADEGRI